jgi:hypothetical protein
MKKIFLFAAATFCTFAVAAQTTNKVRNSLYYAVSFPNAAHHEAEVTLTIPDAPQGAFRVRMSRSSPGRYATHEFGKNVYNVVPKQRRKDRMVANGLGVQTHSFHR